MTKFIFKIRQKSTGLFSSGGASPKFTKMGKSWQSLGHVKNHLRVPENLYMKACSQYPDIQDLELVQYVLKEDAKMPLTYVGVK